MNACVAESSEEVLGNGGSSTGRVGEDCVAAGAVTKTMSGISQLEQKSREFTGRRLTGHPSHRSFSESTLDLLLLNRTTQRSRIFSLSPSDIKRSDCSQRVFFC